MNPTILETERLILRQQTIEDAGFLLELMNEPGFIKYVADRGLRTTADAADYLREKIIPSYEKFGFGFYRVELKESGTRWTTDEPCSVYERLSALPRPATGRQSGCLKNSECGFSEGFTSRATDRKACSSVNPAGCARLVLPPKPFDHE
jgi:hypothetical protein